MQHQVDRARNRVDLVDGNLQCPRHVLVCCLVKTDVAVADLNEAEVSATLAMSCRAASPGSRKQFRSGHATVHDPEKPGARQDNAAEKVTPIDAIAQPRAGLSRAGRIGRLKWLLRASR